MFKILIKGALLGGIIIFLWSAFSWMVLPWHKVTMHKFTNEAAVAETIKNNIPQSAVYLLPSEESKMSQGPLVFAAVHQGGMSGMGSYLLIGLITQIIAAFLVTWMVSKTKLSYGGRLGFILIFALAAGIATELPYWNWFNFSNEFTVVEIIDLLIGWFLAGLVIAKIVGSRNRASSI